MPSESVLDLDELLAPIAGGEPGGSPLPFATRKKLEEARKEVDPKAFRLDDPMRPPAPVAADWTGIIRLSRETLTRTSKDLLVAARLTEALTKVHGFAGARDGLKLLHRMVTESWDAIHPVIEDGDLEVRASAFNWLDDVDRGSRFPNTLRGVPLVAFGDVTFSLRDWKALQTAKAPEEQPAEPPPEDQVQRTTETFNKAIAATPREQCQTTLDDLAECLQGVDAITEDLRAKMGDLAPGLIEVRKALVECQDLARQIMDRKGPAPIEAGAAEEEAPPETEGAAEEETRPQRNGAAPRGATTREELYAQLERASAQLLRLEPHSPTAYLIQRAVRLSKLPLPQLFRVLIQDPNTLAQLDRDLDLGMGEEAPGG